MLPWNRRRRERDLEDELRAHLDMAAADARERGEPETAALREFGNRDLVKETTRDIWGRNPFHGFGQDVRAAFRTVRKNSGFASIVILTLALGIGANTAIFSLIDAVVLRYLPVQRPEELVQVREAFDNSQSPNPVWEKLRDTQDVFSSIFAYAPNRFNLARGGEARYARGLWVSGEFFSTLGVHAALGRTFTPSDDRRGCAAAAILGYDFWRNAYGGDPAMLGRAISIDGHPFQVIGVGPPEFYGVEVGRASDLYIPLCAELVSRGAESQLDRRDNWWLSMIGRPKPGIVIGQVNARLKTLARPVYEATIPPRYTPKRQLAYTARRLEAIPAAGGISDFRQTYRTPLAILMVVVGLLLLIACANVANLLLARAAARQKEIAVRMAVGAGRWRLVRQLLTESALFAAAGAALGILFAQWGGRLLVAILSSANSPAFLDLTIDARMLWFTIAVSAAAALLFGLAPAWRVTRVEPQAAMKGNARGIAEGRSRFSIAKALVMIQVAISLVLVSGAALLLTTFWNLSTLDAGFERNRALIVRADLRNAGYPKERLDASFEEMRRRLAAIPGVAAASYSKVTPIGGSMYGGGLIVDDEAHASKFYDVWVNYVSPGYFRALGTPLLAGRDFGPRDTASSAGVAIVNETAARKLFQEPNPLGRTGRAYRSTDTYPVEVVGVVKDTRYGRLTEPQRPIVYIPAAQDPHIQPSITFELRAALGAPGNLAPAAREAIAQVNPNISLEFRTLAVQVAESLTRQRLLATLSGFFGALALLLATLGLYGVISHNMARRRNEIGIRMALGATRGRILRMALGDVAIVVAIGLAAGAAAALALTKFVASFLYGVQPRDPWMLSSAAALFAAVAMLAGYIPARRASRLDPMAALREE